MRRADMSKIKEVLRLKHHSGLSNRQIQTLTGVSKSAVSNYLSRFKGAAVEIERALALSNAELTALLYPELRQNKSRSKSAQRPLPDWNYIHNELKKKGITKLLLWQEYKQQYPQGYGYSQFKEYYSRYVKEINPSMRQVHHVGDKLFVDFSGLTVPIADAVTAEITNAQVFVSVLGASGYTFVHAVLSQSTADFIHCHNKAFSFYEGVAGTVVPDNLKAAVISHTKKNIKLNESYADMARHYGCTVIPARPYRPQDKSKVELGVKGAQRWILAKLRHHTFFDVDELNEAIGELLDAYNNKVIKRFGKSRYELFQQLDKPALHPLPHSEYTYKEHKRLTVGIDYHVECDGNGYSVPYTYKGKVVDLWYSAEAVSVSHKGEIIAVHKRNYGIYQDSTKIEHMPKEHQFAYEKWNPKRIVHWAQTIGDNTAALMKKIMDKRSHPVRGYKSCLAILKFCDHYSNEELEMVCEKALEINAMSVSSIESMLKKKTYLVDDCSEPVNNTLNSHENIRGSAYYK